jgi:hypothetical protein
MLEKLLLAAAITFSLSLFISLRSNPANQPLLTKFWLNAPPQIARVVNR